MLLVHGLLKKRLALEIADTSMNRMHVLLEWTAALVSSPHGQWFAPCEVGKYMGENPRCSVKRLKEPAK
jgi:hypothetical protein